MKKKLKKVAGNRKSGSTGELNKKPELKIDDHREEDKPFDLDHTIVI